MLTPMHGLTHDGPPWRIQNWLTTNDFSMEDSDRLAEFAGRACYESWIRPNPQTRLPGDYLRNIIQRQHFSVLEHASATFYVEQVSRTCTHELVRHRHLSFSQRSQRYVDEHESVAVVPDAVRAIRDQRLPNDQTIGEAFEELNDRSLQLYKLYVDALVAAGYKRKEARGAARSILLANTQTSLVVTGNHRAWREMIAKRWHVAADLEIRQLAGLFLRELSKIAPHTYADFDLNRPIGTPPADA